MSKDVAYFSSLVEPELRDRAGWRGVLFGSFPDGETPPFMGLLYANEEAGRRVFANLRQRLGEVDAGEELRVCIVEGDIPGQDAGYSVLIGSEPDALKRRAEAQGVDAPKVIMTLTRFHRMNPAPGSPFLARFKSDYKTHQRYTLLPAFGGPSNMSPAPDLAIAKKTIHLRRVEEVKQGDVDSVIFGPPKKGH